MNTRRISRSRHVALTTLMLSMACCAEAGDVYRNDFANRTSRTAMPAGQWHEMTYLCPASLYFNYSAGSDSFDANLPYSNYERFQDGWTKQWRSVGNSMVNFWVMPGSGQDNPCGVMCTATSGEQTLAAHPFYNSFSNGSLRIQVDFRAPAKSPYTGILRFRPMFRQAMDPAWTLNATYPLSFGLCNYGNEDGCSMMPEAVYVKDGDFQLHQLETWALSGRAVDPTHWIRFVATVDLDRKRWTCLAYDMGVQQPTLKTPTPETPLAEPTKEFYYYRDMTAETGPITGVGIYASKLDYSGSLSNLEMANAALTDNIVVAWKRPSSDEYEICYENDFKTRRYRTVDLVPDTSFNYAIPVSASPATFKGYFNGMLVSEAVSSWYDEGLPGVDRWCRNDNQYATAQIQKDALVFDSANTYGMFTQSIGEDLTSGKVRVVTDFKTPSQWSGLESSHSVTLVMGPAALTGVKDVDSTQNALRVGITSDKDNLTSFRPWIQGETGDWSQVVWEANHWYRVEVTADVDARKYRCRFYDLGAESPSFETSGTLVFESGDFSFRGDPQLASIGAFGIVLYRGENGSWNGRVACDNIRVCKQTSGSSSWTDVYSTDFKTTRRYGETSSAAAFVSDVPNGMLDGSDQWIRRLVNAPGFKPTAKMTLAGTEDPCVKVSDARDGYAFAVQSLGKSMRTAFTLQADIRAPYGYASNSDKAQVSVALGGEDFYQGDVCLYDSANPHEASAYAAAVFGFRCKVSDNKWSRGYLSSVRICAFDGNGEGGGDNVWSSEKVDSDTPHWYRFKALVDVQKSTYDLEVLDLGLTRPADDSVSGVVVATWKGLGFRRRQANGISAVGIGACGVVEPWNAPTGDCTGAALFDNLSLVKDDNGFILQLR